MNSSLAVTSQTNDHVVSLIPSVVLNSAADTASVGSAKMRAPSLPGCSQVSLSDVTMNHHPMGELIKPIDDSDNSSQKSQLEYLRKICINLERVVRIQGYDTGAAVKQFGPSPPSDFSIEDISHLLALSFKDWTFATRALSRAVFDLSSMTYALPGCELFTHACDDFHSHLLEVACHLEGADSSIDRELSFSQMKVLIGRLRGSARDLQDNLVRMQEFGKILKIKSWVTMRDSASSVEKLDGLLEGYGSIVDDAAKLDQGSRLWKLRELAIQLFMAIEDVNLRFSVVTNRAIPFIIARTEKVFWIQGAVATLATFFLSAPAARLSQLSDPWGHPTSLHGLINGTSVNDRVQEPVDIPNILGNSFAALSFAFGIIALVSSVLVLHLSNRQYATLSLTIDDYTYSPPSNLMMNVPISFLMAGIITYFVSIFIPLWVSFVEFVVLAVAMAASTYFLLHKSWNWFIASRTIRKFQLREVQEEPEPNLGKEQHMGYGSV